MLRVFAYVCLAVLVGIRLFSTALSAFSVETFAILTAFSVLPVSLLFLANISAQSKPKCV